MIRIIIINLQKKLIGQLPINFKNLYIYAFIYDGNIYILEFSYNFIYLVKIRDIIFLIINIQISKFYI